MLRLNFGRCSAFDAPLSPPPLRRSLSAMPPARPTSAAPPAIAGPLAFSMTLDMPDACAGFGVLRFREREAPPLDREPAERERLAVLFAFEPFELERRALPFEL